MNCWAQQIEQGKIQLHLEDAISTKLWVDRLKDNNVKIFLKDKATDPPLGSYLDKTCFILCIQTPFQLDAFRRLGNGFIGINATHNMTQYLDFLLFMIIARDWWGHGTSSCILPFRALISKNRCSCRLDVIIQWNDGNDKIFP